MNSTMRMKFQFRSVLTETSNSTLRLHSRRSLSEFVATESL
jgi:hypothetical protein